MKNYLLSENFFLCQDTAGNPLEVTSGPGEIVCIAYDYKATQLVELHLFSSSDTWTSGQFQEIFERLLLLAGVNDGSVPRVLRFGRVDGLAFYTTALEEGEGLVEYVRRVGPLPERGVLALLNMVVAKLLSLQEWPRLFRACSLDGAGLIHAPHGMKERPVIQIRNFGLSSAEIRGDEAVAEHLLAGEVASLVYLMLTGFVNPQRGGPELEAVRLLDHSAALRQFVEAKFNNELRQLTLNEAARALEAARPFVSPSQAESADLPAFDPSWVHQIFGGAKVDLLYPVQFEPQGSVPIRVGEMHSRIAMDRSSKRSVFLLPLPGKNVLPRPEFVPVPPGLDAIPPEAATHLCFPHATWSSDSFCFHVENPRYGFTLKSLTQQRSPLSPQELLHVLREIHSGLDQAQALDLKLPSLNTHAIRGIFGAASDQAPLEQWAAMSILEWPPHRFQVSVHATLGSLTCPWPVGAGPDRPESGRLADAFVLLALELLGGVENLDNADLPESFVHLLRSQATLVRKKDPVLAPGALVKAMEEALAAPASQSPSHASPPVQELVPEETLESLQEPPTIVETVAIAAEPPIELQPQEEIPSAVEETACDPGDVADSPAAIVDEISEIFLESPAAEPSPVSEACVPSSPAPLFTEIALPENTATLPVADSIPDTEIAPFPTAALEPEEIITVVLMEMPSPEQARTKESGPAEHMGTRNALPTQSIPEVLSILDETADAFQYGSDEDNGVPMMNIDLDRLTTADTLFSRRARTITIRNK